MSVCDERFSVKIYVNSFMKIHLCEYNFAQIYKNCAIFCSPKGLDHNFIMFFQPKLFRIAQTPTPLLYLK